MTSDVVKRLDAIWEMMESYPNKGDLNAYTLGRLITNTTDEEWTHLFSNLRENKVVKFWRENVEASVTLVKGSGSDKDVVRQRAEAIVAAFPAPLAEISPHPAAGNPVFWISVDSLLKFASKDLAGISFLGNRLNADWGRTCESKPRYRGLPLSSDEVADKYKLMATFNELCKLI